VTLGRPPTPSLSPWTGRRRPRPFDLLQGAAWPRPRGGGVPPGVRASGECLHGLGPRGWRGLRDRRQCRRGGRQL